MMPGSTLWRRIRLSKSSSFGSLGVRAGLVPACHSPDNPDEPHHRPHYPGDEQAEQQQPDNPAAVRSSFGYVVGSILRGQQFAVTALCFESFLLSRIFD